MNRHSAEKKELVSKLNERHDLSDSELKTLIESAEPDTELFQAADALRKKVYGEDVYTTTESDRLVRLPMYYNIKPGDLSRVIEKTREFLER